MPKAKAAAAIPLPEAEAYRSPMTPYSVTRWASDDLTASVEEIAISQQDFELLKQKRAPEGTPDWIEDTPRMEYRLEAFGSHSDNPEQKISLTDDEYGALKQHLAVMRGHLPAEAA